MREHISITLSEDELRSIIREELNDSIEAFLGKHLKNLYESYPIEDKILNSIDAAKFLGISRVTLAEWIKNDTVPFRREGRRLLFSKRELLIWAREDSKTKKQRKWE